MAKFVRSLAALRAALALVASVFVLSARPGIGEASAIEVGAKGATSVQLSARIVHGPIHLLMQVTGAPARALWLPGSGRRSQRSSPPSIVAIAATGCFPDHCASAWIQMVSRTVRGHRAGLDAHVCAAPTRAPPAVS